MREEESPGGVSIQGISCARNDCGAHNRQSGGRIAIARHDASSVRVYILCSSIIALNQTIVSEQRVRVISVTFTLVAPVCRCSPPYYYRFLVVSSSFGVDALRMATLYSAWSLFFPTCSWRTGLPISPCGTGFSSTSNSCLRTHTASQQGLPRTTRGGPAHLGKVAAKGS